MDYCGLDLGKRSSNFCIVDAQREVLREGKVACRERALSRVFEKHERLCLVLEASNNSFWIANLLEDWGHEVHVVDPNRTKAIGVSLIKNDRRDAVWLAKLASAVTGQPGSSWQRLSSHRPCADAKEQGWAPKGPRVLGSVGRGV
jgi:transposase